MVQRHYDYTNESRGDLLVAVRNRGDSSAFALFFAGILALGVVVSIAIANIVFTGNAHADAPQGDSIDACRALQTDYDNAIAGLNDATASAATRATLIGRIDEVGDFWELQCASDFGDIAVAAQATPASTTTNFEALDFGPADAGSTNFASTTSIASGTN
jgi:hypothetical protein